MTSCLLGIGSNLGPQRSLLEEAVDRLDAHPEIAVRGTSRWHASRAVGGPAGQPVFLNGALLVETDLDARGLLDVMLELETRLGRRRNIRWGPRNLDLDLLLFGDQIVDRPGLVVPHPWMAIRHFVLAPACELAAERVHPQIGWTMAQLLENLESPEIRVAVAGIGNEQQRQLVHRVAAELSAVLLSEKEFRRSARRRVPREDESVECDRGNIGSVGPLAGRRPSEGHAEVPSQPRLELADFWLEPVESELTQPRTNLLILLQHDSTTLTQSETEQQRLRIRSGSLRGRGPFLILSTVELERLQHDLTAAIRGMMAES